MSQVEVGAWRNDKSGPMQIVSGPMLTSSKYAGLAICSQDTAVRDIDDLVTRRCLVKDAGGGRSTSYSLLVAA